MKKHLLGLLVAGSAAAVPAAIPALAPAKSSVTATAAKAKSYPNCTALHRNYPHGVGKRNARDHVRGSTDPVTNFKRSNKLYRLNSHLDRDGDHVACEQD